MLSPILLQGLYFKNLESSDGDKACLARIDKRGGDCPQEVAAMLYSIVKECCQQTKKKRPVAATLLQKVITAEELYREKTGMSKFWFDVILNLILPCKGMSRLERYVCKLSAGIA
jgi:hypothetical protein